MELMLWLMTRSPVELSRCSGDLFETTLSDDGGDAAAAVAVIFGFVALTRHFGGSQG
jgi:hypothetical protein